MPRKRPELARGLTESMERVAASVFADRDDLRWLRDDLARVAEAKELGTYQRGVADGLLGVVEVLVHLADRDGSIADRSARLEPGSLPARMLLEIANGVRGANADLADRLDTDQWQISRAGRRLRELALADRTRAGRLNSWTLTRAGEREASQLLGRPPSSTRRA